MRIAPYLPLLIIIWVLNMNSLTNILLEKRLLIMQLRYWTNMGTLGILYWKKLGIHSKMLRKRLREEKHHRQSKQPTLLEVVLVKYRTFTNLDWSTLQKRMEELLQSRKSSQKSINMTFGIKKRYLTQENKRNSIFIYKLSIRI